MKLVVQRVLKTKVIKVKDGTIVGEIDNGLFVLVGIVKEDTKKEAERLAEKLSKLRIMKDEEKKMNLSVKEVGGEILVVSQFTLCADCRGQNRPSFIKAMEPKKAKELYEYFVNELKGKGLEVKTGSFGDYMRIETLLDGPVTIELTS